LKSGHDQDEKKRAVAHAALNLALPHVARGASWAWHGSTVDQFIAASRRTGAHRRRRAQLRAQRTCADTAASGLLI